MSFSFDSKPGESDPTADFLSRERDALQALGGGDDLLSGGGGSGAGVDKTADDFERGASAFPALDGEDDGGFGGSASAPAPAAAPAAPAAAAASSASRAPTGDLFGGDEDDEQEQEKKRFESNYPAFDDPDLDAPPAPIASQPTAAPASSFSAAAAPAQSTVSDAGHIIAVQHNPGPEPCSHRSCPIERLLLQRQGSTLVRRRGRWDGARASQVSCDEDSMPSVPGLNLLKLTNHHTCLRTKQGMALEAS